MPWRKETMKDVTGCDKPRVAANKLWSEDVRMGEPTLRSIFNWIHRLRKQTRRTEISNVAGGKEIKETPLVVTSERGPGQCH